MEQMLAIYVVFLPTLIINANQQLKTSSDS